VDQFSHENQQKQRMHACGREIHVTVLLKPIYANLAEKEWVGTDGQEECSTTPNGEEVRFCKSAMQAD
jgi:metal-dependent amidase/aminoacylase/carboxypeptidase family protein